MLAKERKTLYLPQWVVKMLDDEGSAYAGPGLAASVAIWDFWSKSETAKKRIYKKYSQYEIDSEYGCAGAEAAMPAPGTDADRDEADAHRLAEDRKRKKSLHDLVEDH